MADHFSKDMRSFIMSRIRSENTQVELKLRRLLWMHGLRGYRIHLKLPGKPDVAFTKKRLAIFVDGDFWHGYNWKALGKLPPAKYWRGKICRNMKRDQINKKLLRRMGWRVLRFWEHEVKKSPDHCIMKIEMALK